MPQRSPFLVSNSHGTLKRAGMSSIALRWITAGFFLIITLARMSSSAGAVSCSMPNDSNYYGSNIGFQYVGQACPESGKYIYNRFELNCSLDGFAEGLNRVMGSTPRTPDEMQTLLTDYYNNVIISDPYNAYYIRNLKVFRNSTGSSFVFVVPAYSQYHQSIDGKDMGSSSYAYWPTFNSLDFGLFNYPSGQTPPCCIDVPTPLVNAVKPGLSELIPIESNITANYPVTWELLVNNIQTSGTNTSQIPFNGKLQNGDPFLPGIYDATLTIKSPGCTDVPTTFQVPVTEPPNDSACFGCFGSDANLAGGALTHSDRIISINSGLLPLALSIDYNSQDASTSTLGPYWRHSLDITLSDAGHDALLLRSGGTKRLYTYSNGLYFAPAGDHGTLTGGPGSAHTLTYTDGTVFDFAADGRISTIKDRYQNQLAFDYSSGPLTTVSDSTGRKLTFGYSGGIVQSVTDPTGNSYTFIPSEEGKLWKVVNPVANTDNVPTYFEYTYNATNGLLQSRKDPNGNTTQYTYDTDSVTNTKRAKTSVDPDGLANPAYHTRTITYPPTPTTPSTGNIQILTTSVIEKDGGNWTYSYDVKKGSLTSVSNAETGNTTQYYYDATGNLKAITVPFNGATRLTTFYSYDGNGNLLTETDPVDISGYPTLQAMGYDLGEVSLGYLASLTPPITTAVSYSWDGFSRITQISNLRDTTALTTTISYTTEQGTDYELTTITDPENNVSKIRSYPATNADRGKIKEIEDGNFGTTGNKTVFSYYPVVENDAKSGQLKDIIGIDNVKTTFTDYDWNGNPKGITVHDKDGVLVPVSTTMAYDALNRLRGITRTLTTQNKILTNTFDFNQNGALTTKDPQQNADSTSGTRYDFNYNNKVKQITDALSHVSTLTYGGQDGGIDQLTSVKDPRQVARGTNGKSTQFKYDKLGRLEREIDPNNKVIRYAYYGNGLLMGKYDATSGDPGTLLMSYTYNNRGQLLTKTRSDNSYDQYTYKANGYLETATTRNTDGSILISYSFDWYKNGWLKSVTDITAGLPGTPIANYDLYDGIGQRKTVRFFSGTADQREIIYDYDTANRPWHIKDDFGTSGNATDDITFTYDYDSRGRRWHLAYPGIDPIVATYGFDDFDRLTGIEHKITSGAVIASVAYPTFDGADNRKSKTTDTTAETYIYDLLYRIYQTATPSGTEQFLYDEAGNRTYGPGPMDIRYVTDPDSNKMTSGRLLDYGYDNRGNQTTRTVPTATDKSWTQYWDSEDRLTRVEKIKEIKDANGAVVRTDKRTVTFSYDPFGRRIGKTFAITQTPTGGSASTVAAATWKFVYDNEDIVFEIYTELNKAAEKTFNLHGPGIDEPLALVRGGQYYTYHADGLGSIIAIADQSKAIVERYSYDTYGMTTPELGFRNTYTFTGRELDKEVGLQYYRARYKDLLDGNFIGKDPLSFSAGDVNLWGYVQNNPINFIDPSGLFSFNPVTRNLIAALTTGGVPRAIEVLELMSNSKADRYLIQLRNIQNIFNKYPLSSGKCYELADNLVNYFNKVGVKPITHLIQPTRRLVIIGEQGFWDHKVVQVGNRIYDAYTGSSGLLVSEYIDMLNKLNGVGNWSAPFK